MYFRYADQKISELREQNLLSSHSRLKKWTPLTVTEMYGLLSLVLNMGIINVPELASYWSTSWTSHIPFFGNILPRNLIFWMLHVSSVPVGQTPKRQSASTPG